MKLLISEMIWMLAVSVLLTEARASSTAEIIYMCPKRFHAVNKYCYHFSKKTLQRMDAYPYCESIHSNFAELQTQQEWELLAEYLGRKYRSGKFNEYWIDGVYNHRLSSWHWGANGEAINSTFANLNKGQSFMFKCIALDGKGTWTARNCMEHKKVICRTEAKGRIEFVVSEKKKRMKLEKCSSGARLNKYEREVCSQLLGTAENNDPGFISIPRSTKSTKRYQRWVCPPNMVSLGSKCYYFSKVQKTLKKAHFECRKNRTSLAFINTKKQDHNLRRFLNHFIEKQERWIDGVYDKSSGQWKSMESGNDLTYKAFIKGLKGPNTNQWYAVFMDPKHHNQWNIASEFEQKYFICQVKAKAIKLMPRKRLTRPVATIQIITN